MIGARAQIESALGDWLEAGEPVEVWRPVISVSNVDDWSYEPVPGARRTITGRGEAPHRTNLIVVTDRHMFWCNRSFPSSPIVPLGSTLLGTLREVELSPSRVERWRLQFRFTDDSVVVFELLSDHGAEGFTADVRLLARVATTTDWDLARRRVTDPANPPAMFAIDLSIPAR